MTESVEKENDSSTSSTEMNDDSDKNETEHVKLLCLIRFGDDRAREVVGHHGMGMEDLQALAEQTFADVPQTSSCKFRLQYFNKRWKDWVDIQQDFIMESDLQIRIVNDKQEVNVNLQETKKRNLLDKLKEIRKKPRSHSSVAGHAQVKINIGWKHFHGKSRSFQQVKSVHGGGTVTVKVPRNACYDHIVDTGKGCFFPHGSSSKGEARNMQFSIGNFQGHELSREAFSLENIYDMYGSKTRIYLFSREDARKESEVVDVDDETDSSELTDPGLRDILDEAPVFIPFQPPSISSQPLPSTSQASLSTLQPLPSTSQQLLSTSQQLLSTSQPLLSTFQQPLPSTSQPLPSTSESQLPTSQASLSTSQQLPSTSQPLLSTFQQPLPSTSQPLPSTSQPLPSTSELLLPTSQLPSPPSQLPSVATTVASVFVDAGTPTVSIKKTACGICCDRPKNAFLLPCGHTLCMPCATHFMTNNLQCPYCKVQPIRVGTIFD